MELLFFTKPKKHNYNRILKSVSMAMCAVMLSLAIMTSYTMPVQAAGNVIIDNFVKLVDMALLKTGVSANGEILNEVSDYVVTEYYDIVNQYATYLEEEYGDIGNVSVSTFNEFMEACGLASSFLTKCIASAIALSVDIFAVTLENIGDLFVNVDEESETDAYTLNDDAVEYIRDTFDSVIEDGGYGYYYVDTYTARELPSNWFRDTTSYENVKSYIRSSEYMTLIAVDKAQIYTYGNNSEFLIVREKTESASSAYFYNADWTTHQIYYAITSKTGAHNYTDYETFSALSLSTNTYLDPAVFYPLTAGTYEPSMMLFTETGEKTIIYESLDALKAYNGGTKPYYQVTTNDYSVNNDNSIDFTGDYYNDNSSTYSYDVIQNQIDNSTEVNEETINNIVNDSSTTIVNNYYYTSDSGSGSDSSGGDSSTSFGDGVASFLEGILNVLDFLLGVLGEVATLLTTFLNNIFALLQGLGGTFASFSTLLGELFVFIPQELIDLLGAGISAIILVSIVKMIKG